MRTDRDRWDQLGDLAKHVPVLVNGLDPELDRDSEDCAAFPDDPAEASRLVEDNLAFFDTNHISWTLSEFVPGKLIVDCGRLAGTKLDDGWICGARIEVPAGIGLLLLSHLWGAPDTHGLFAVNGTRGGLVLPRDGISTAYGPILAEREMSANARPLPHVLGNVSVRVTDSRGVARFAPLLYTGAGWAFLSFIVPPSAALGRFQYGR